MALFDISKKKVFEIQEYNFDLEKDLQSLIEDNLEIVFNLKVIKSEIQLNGLRIDTLAFDPENNTFVIIEYKRDRNFSVIDQGMSYLSLMVNNKAEFILAYNESGLGMLKKDEVDWSQAKVLFLAQHFSKYQRNAINFKNLPIELWEVRKYKNETLHIREIKSDPNSESFSKIVGKNEEYDKVSKTFKQYGIDDHLKNVPQETIVLFKELSNKIQSLDDRIEINPVKKYIGFVIDGKNVVAIYVRKNYLILSFGRTRPEDLTDLENRLKYKTTSMKHHNQHISEMKIGNVADLNYAIQLTRELLEKLFS